MYFSLTIDRPSVLSVRINHHNEHSMIAPNITHYSDDHQWDTWSVDHREKYTSCTVCVEDSRISPTQSLENFCPTQSTTVAWTVGFPVVLVVVLCDMRIPFLSPRPTPCLPPVITLAPSLLTLSWYWFEQQTGPSPSLLLSESIPIQHQYRK